MTNYLQDMMDAAEKPTERQMRYARSLAEHCGVELDEGITRAEIGDFIKRHKPWPPPLPPWSTKLWRTWERYEDETRYDDIADIVGFWGPE